MTDDETMTLADELETAIDGGEPDFPEDDDAPETETAESEPEDHEGDVDDSEGDGEPEPEEEYAEVSIDGKTYKVPAELRDGYLRHGDYTRKTQEVATMRRSLEERQQQLVEYETATQHEAEARVRLKAIDMRLSQFNQVNWQQLDPAEKADLSAEILQLRSAKEQVEGFIQQTHQTRRQQQEEMTAKRIEETKAYAQKEIPGWSEALDREIEQTAINSLGWPREQLIAALNPRVYNTLRLAHIGLKSLERGTAKKPAASVPNIKPLKTVSAKTGGTSTKAPHEMSMAEYDAWASKRFKG